MKKLDVLLSDVHFVGEMKDKPKLRFLKKKHALKKEEKHTNLSKTNELHCSTY